MGEAFSPSLFGVGGAPNASAKKTNKAQDKSK
jgi:hypothetical protein